MFKKFLSLPKHSIRVGVKGKRINRGVGYGLKIPVEYIFYGDGKTIQWAKRTLDGVNGNVKKKSSKMFKIVLLKKNQPFPSSVLFFLACSLLRDNFHRDNPNRTWTFCPLMRGAGYFCPLFRSFL